MHFTISWSFFLTFLHFYLNAQETIMKKNIVKNKGNLVHPFKILRLFIEYTLAFKKGKFAFNFQRVTLASCHFKHGGSCETFLSTIMDRFTLTGLCRWCAKVVLHHAKIVISGVATQPERHMVFFWNLADNRMIHILQDDTHILHNGKHISR